MLVNIKNYSNQKFLRNKFLFNAFYICRAENPMKSLTQQDEIFEHKTIQFDSDSSDEEEVICDEAAEDSKRMSTKFTEVACNTDEELDSQQSTMWLGTEDGCVHVYNSNDNIRIKKNKIKLQHGSSILSIM